MSPPRRAEPPSAGLDIIRRIVDGTVLVAVAGEVDIDTAPALRAALTTAIDQAGGAPCILDLTAVTFLNSTGLTTLLGATTRAGTRHVLLRIVVDSNRPVIRPIEITGLDEALRLHHTVDEALQAGTQLPHPRRDTEPETPTP